MERLGDHLRQAEKKIAALEAKLQAREPIGQWKPVADIGFPTIDTWKQRVQEKQDHIAQLEADRIRREMQAQMTEWRKPAQPDLFPSHKPLRSEPHPANPSIFYAPPKELQRWMDEGSKIARGYVDPNRPDQAKAVVLPSGVKITGVSASGVSVGELINRFWAENAQAAQAQADRDGENLKK